MITENRLDVRTITMGISLRDCAHPNLEKFCQNVYEKITRSAEYLVQTGEDIETEYGIPIIVSRSRPSGLQRMRVRRIPSSL